MIVFLDIDGVIIPFSGETSPYTQKQVKTAIILPNEFLNAVCEKNVSNEAVCAINELVEDLGAKIVLHSWWRKMFNYEICQKFLEDLKLDTYLHEDWFCDCGNGSSKANEIYYWLAKHPQHKNCVVIDDELIFDHFDKLWEYQWLTDSKVGFTYDMKNRIVKWATKKFSLST